VVGGGRGSAHDRSPLFLLREPRDDYLDIQPVVLLGVAFILLPDFKPGSPMDTLKSGILGVGMRLLPGHMAHLNGSLSYN
jgi:hypothetical protein